MLLFEKIRSVEGIITERQEETGQEEKERRDEIRELHSEHRGLGKEDIRLMIAFITGEKTMRLGVLLPLHCKSWCGSLQRQGKG